jgi:glycosyltransferase involved in cell wall biosynthesis
LTDPEVSLLMAAHSPRPDWLRAAVASALAQAGCSFELIVVDDGSPEPVANLLTDPRARVLRIDHAGLGAARNAGVAASRGRWLRFLDADDVYPPDSTAALLHTAGRRSDVVACGTTRWCREDLSPVRDWPVTWRGDALRALLLMRCTITPPASMLVPRALAEAVGPWRTDLPIVQDLDYEVRLLERGDLAATRRVVSWYRQHPAALSKDGSIALADCIRVVEAYFDRHPEQRGTGLERQATAALEMLAAEIEGAPGGPWRDRRFWRALARDPGAVAFVYERQVQPRVSRLRMRAALRADRRTARPATAPSAPR